MINRAELLDTPPVRPVVRTPDSAAVRFRKRAGAAIVDGFFRGTSRAASYIPISHPRLHGVEVLRNIPYQSTNRHEHLLDVWRPRRRTGALPVVFYVHGGGFRILSKDSHWIFGLIFARRGYIAVNINYRLSPKHRFPAALEDTAAAFHWTLDHIHEYGGDPSRVIVAGESAGANLVTALTVATCTPRPEAWARKLFDRGVVPSVAMPACGVLQVSDTHRFLRQERPVHPFIADRLAEVTDSYLGVDPASDAKSRELADPLNIIEGTSEWARPLPPFFVPVGTADPLIDDTRRLAVALKRLGVAHEARYYKYGPHAFHAFVPLRIARQCWQDTFKFLGQHLPATPRPA